MPAAWRIRRRESEDRTNAEMSRAAFVGSWVMGSLPIGRQACRLNNLLGRIQALLVAHFKSTGEMAVASRGRSSRKASLVRD
jgi:hypothetical protein